MNTLSIVLIVFIVGIIALLVFAGIVVKGAITSTENITNYKRRKLSGVQVEDIRRRLLLTQFRDIMQYEVLDLIYTVKALQIGDYLDKEPYMPADPYDGLEEKEDVIELPEHRI